MAARRVDWSFGPGHGPVSGVVNAAGSALGLTMVADLAAVPPLWGLVGGTVAATGATIASLAQNAPGKALAYRAACWFGAGGWSTWALATATSEPFSGPWSTTALASLAVGTIGAAFTGLAFQHSDDRKEERRLEGVAATLEKLQAADAVRALASEHDRVAVTWQAELRRQTRREVEVVGVEFWDPNTGFTLDVELPADGTTIEDIKPYEKPLASAMNVPNGCAVEIIDPGISRRVVHIRVGTEDAMALDHHLPKVCEPDSIENDLSLGIRADRTEFTINVRYNCAVLIGQTDSGKSNELNVVTRQIARCTDAMLWAIDLTGNGRYPRPWVRAWKEGRVEAPVIDWVAPTAEEALLMTQAALAIIEGRTADYEQLMFEQGWDKIMVSPEVPELIIVTDEFGSLPDAVKENLQQISDTGRGAGVRAISCALEATGGYIPRAMIAQARERIGMRVQDETQLQYLFDTTWRSGRFDMTTMRVKGSGLGSSDATPPEKFKGWRIEPGQVDADSITVGPWRPELDEASVDRADTVSVAVRNRDGYREQREFTSVYTNRWDRTLPLIFPPARTAGQQRRKESIVASEGAGPRSEQPRREAGPSLGDALADLEAGRKRLQEIEPVPDPGPSEPELPPLPADADFSVVESWLTPGTPATDASGRRKPHPRLRMRQLVWDAGDQGANPGPIHRALESEGYGTAYQTVRDWMGDDAKAEILDQPGGKKTPYVRGQKMTNPYESQG